MSLTEFAMVEELAFLVKDNIPCKHLILSMEDALVNFLQNDTSLHGVLELEPMNPYNRLLVHRLADIFGFSHQSVGEGEDRHLVLERCPETSMPSIFVSDLLWEFGEVQSPVISDVLRREEVIPGQRHNATSESSLEEREAAYFAARERIFRETKMVKQRPQNNPAVARRMITRALGKTNEVSLSNTMEHGWIEKDRKFQCEDDGDIKSSKELDTKLSARPCIMSKVHKSHGSESSSTSKVAQQKNNSTQTSGVSAAERKKNNIHESYSRNEHVGAAKRLFANALGIHRTDVGKSKCDETKRTNC
ncbi:hypothetical protein BUALT_Bualt06G0000500 [Buddleja alternifolia]|uniref:R3H domain-containing protein n=1 Tax=Buddleja alternifolia TaxID=168488 RepID=A0AAV6XI66_9LAMI|nr:hypothetical protein BUALT_Bualt06G0000500 [Buddleja alternifolia]